jgi:nucleotide-binding universal stress UspA family protein
VNTILALVDFSDATPGVIKLAGQFGRVFGATVYLVHVSDLESDRDRGTIRADVSRNSIAREVRRKHRSLRIAAKVQAKLGTKAVALLVRGSPVAKAIKELARRSPDLVIVGKHRRGRLIHMLTGRVGAAVVRHARCPVLVVPFTADARSGTAMRIGVAPCIGEHVTRDASGDHQRETGLS